VQAEQNRSSSQCLYVSVVTVFKVFAFVYRWPRVWHCRPRFKFQSLIQHLGWYPASTLLSQHKSEHYNFLSYILAKYCTVWSTFNQVIAKIKRCPFYGSHAY